MKLQITIIMQQKKSQMHNKTQVMKKVIKNMIQKKNDQSIGWRTQMKIVMIQNQMKVLKAILNSGVKIGRDIDMRLIQNSKRITWTK